MDSLGTSELLEFRIAKNYTIFYSRYQFSEFRLVMGLVRSSSCRRVAVSASVISFLVSAPSSQAAAHQSFKIAVIFNSTAANEYLILSFTCGPLVGLSSPFPPLASGSILYSFEEFLILTVTFLFFFPSWLTKCGTNSCLTL